MKSLDLTATSGGLIASLDAGEQVRSGVFGRRAWKLARLKSLGLPVPEGIALSFDCTRGLSEGAELPDLADLHHPAKLIAVRSSPGERSWGGADAIRHIGIGERSLPLLSAEFGMLTALDLYRHLICDIALVVHGVDPEDFGAPDPDPSQASCLEPERLRHVIDEMLVHYARETGEPFPQDTRDQVEQVARAMARSWNSPSARILREARGAPADAGLGLIVQEMVLGYGPVASGTGHLQLVDGRTGVPTLHGGFVLHSGQRNEVQLLPLSISMADPGQDSLEKIAPDAFTTLKAAAREAARGLGEFFCIEFAVHDGQASILDALPVRRTARGAVRMAVDLAHDGAITRNTALLRIEPRTLIEHLHPQIDPSASRDVFAAGIGASPGAATGRIVFSAEAAQTAAAQDEAAILVRTETSPEDIRGMHSARGVLTIRGGMTSHAAVIARGIGLPCVVGASGLRLDLADRSLATKDGRIFREGSVITLDGTRGEVMAGAPDMIAPELGGAFSELLDWADAVRDLGVRANADTPAEARAARKFHADGLGLCRTEHMFFDEARIGAMRRMILADSESVRSKALAELLPMQRADFKEIFDIMRGLPVTIRLLDLPLHEFLPTSPDGVAEFAASIGFSPEEALLRARSLSEVNPMLGMRGVRLGLIMPEIYAMQARAIFEAALDVDRQGQAQVVPEIMVPMVSANREVELVRDRISSVADEVAAERGQVPRYKLGVMLETPRAALRAGDLAVSSSFLSFGTNDLTQMTYGLSRDDAGRFMREYVNQGIYPEDPFHSLDVEGVGELILIAARRGRARNPTLDLGLCGEHGGDPSSVRFCKLAGFDYVSCSPFRVPIARLAAAQATLLSDAGPAGAGCVE